MIANILIAVGGYLYGWGLANFIAGGMKSKEEWEVAMAFILYTMLWIGICWKYIF